MARLAALAALLTAVVLVILNTVGTEYFRQEIAAVSSHPTRGLVFLNLGGIYFAALLVLPVASMLKLIPLRLPLSRLLVQVAAFGIIVAVALHVTSDQAAAFARIVILVAMGLVSLGAPMSLYADLISQDQGPKQKDRRGPTDLPL